MDIKFVWVEEHRRFAYVITVLDTFTRVALYWHVAYQIRQAQVKSIWEHIIVNYLQPYDCLGKKMQMEIRNDNDSRFIAGLFRTSLPKINSRKCSPIPILPRRMVILRAFMLFFLKDLDGRSFGP